MAGQKYNLWHHQFEKLTIHLHGESWSWAHHPLWVNFDEVSSGTWPHCPQRVSVRGSVRDNTTNKLIDPRWIGINGAFATKSPSGENKAQEKSRRSLMLVLIEVCCNDRPIASAILMKRLAKSVSKMGSGPFTVDISWDCEKHRSEWLSQCQPLYRLTCSKSQ